MDTTTVRLDDSNNQTHTNQDESVKEVLSRYDWFIAHLEKMQLEGGENT